MFDSKQKIYKNIIKNNFSLRKFGKKTEAKNIIKKIIVS